MLDVVVDSRQIQSVPGLVPRHVELAGLSPREVRAIHDAHHADALYARLDRPDGDEVEVKRIWQDPHDPGRITLYLE